MAKIQYVFQINDFIILPLYSVRDNNVPEKSGLNQWNAAGRKRDPDEVYISVPLWIHREFDDFFTYSINNGNPNDANSPSFNVELPNGKALSCRITQANGKALMFNPNKALLRVVLKLKQGKLLTIDKLRELDIDSVKLTKKNVGYYYYLDFMETGSLKY